MNFERVQRKNRKAISPVLATVILIAITLIAAIAVAGFVFGLFGTFTSSAQVGQGSSYVSAGNIGAGTAAALTATCQTAAPTITGTSDGYVSVINSGTAAVTVNMFTLKLAGTPQVFTLAGCTTNPITASSTLYIVLTGKSGVTYTADTQYTGTVGLSNGAQVPLMGALAP